MKLDLRDWVSLWLIQLSPCLQVICIVCTRPTRRPTSTPSPGTGGPHRSPWGGASPPPERRPPRTTRSQVDQPSPPRSTVTAPMVAQAHAVCSLCVLSVLVDLCPLLSRGGAPQNQHRPPHIAFCYIYIFLTLSKTRSVFVQLHFHSLLSLRLSVIHVSHKYTQSQNHTLATKLCDIIDPLALVS